MTWTTVVKVNAGKEFIDGDAIMAFRERCWPGERVEQKPIEDDLLAIPAFLDRRKNAQVPRRNKCRPANN